MLSIIVIKPRDMEKLMADDHFIRSMEMCTSPEAIGYYIGKYCLSEVIVDATE